MAATIVTKESRFISSNKMIVVLEADRPEELDSQDALELATRHAVASGLPSPGFGLPGGFYPVADAADPTKTARYRMDHELNGSI